MIYGMKPFNSAEMREYLDKLTESPETEIIPGQEEITESEFPGTHGDWMHGGFKVRYNPSTKTVTVQGKNQERSHKFTTDPTERSYHSAVQQIIDKLEDEAELEESRSESLVMREWMTICR